MVFKKDSSNIKEMLTSMTIREKIGQMLVAAYFDKAMGKMLVSEGYGGIWPHFGRLGLNTSEEMWHEICEMNKYAKIPLLISSDMETGVGQYCHDGTCTEFPGLMAFGAIKDIKKAERLAYAAGCVMAAEAPLTGVNITPSPVVDVNTVPENPICNIRSVGDNPEVVSRITSAMIRGMQSKNNLIAMAKHFPGEGMHKFDPHFDFEKMEVSQEEMERIHIKPFIQSMQAGVKCIMTNHAIYSTFDNDHPCTLSKKIITDLLRKQLNYQGLVMTDAMEMQGITSRYGDEEALIMAVEAGNDLILAPGKQESAIDILEKNVLSGRIPLELIEEAVERILNAKQWLGLFEKRENNAVLEDKLKRDSLAREIAEESITMIRNEGGLIPMKATSGKYLVLEPSHPNKVLEIGLNFNTFGLYEEVLGVNPDTEYILFPVEPSESEINEIASVASEYSAVIIGTSFRSFAGQVGLLTNKQVELLRKVVETVPNTSFVASNPYVVAELPFAKAILVNYGTSKLSVEASVNVLFGKQKATGILPVSLPEKVDASSVKIVAHD